MLAKTVFGDTPAAAMSATAPAPATALRMLAWKASGRAGRAAAEVSEAAALAAGVDLLAGTGSDRPGRARTR